MKKQFIRLSAVFACLALLSACAGAPPAAREDGKLRVTAAIFPAYDFARAVCGDLAEVSLLLPPGAESHSYEPTPRDLLAVGDSDLFLYLGGESDAWVGTILDSVDGDVNTLTLMESAETLEREREDTASLRDHSRAEGETAEYDEHVWTAPVNAAAITRAIGAEMARIDPENAAAYSANAESYADQIMAVDRAFRAFFKERDNKTLVFGDRFPLQYFAGAYGLDCYAAFPGCSTQTEPSAATVAALTDRVEAEGLTTVYYIEFSNHLVADSIAEAAGAQTALFHSCHNVSQADLDAGATYVSLMEGNLETLRATMP